MKGWNQGRESDTPEVRTPTVLSCTSTVLREYASLAFSPWLGFNIIEKIDLIHIRKKSLNVKYNIDIYTLGTKIIQQAGRIFLFYLYLKT